MVYTGHWLYSGEWGILVCAHWSDQCPVKTLGVEHTRHCILLLSKSGLYGPSPGREREERSLAWIPSGPVRDFSLYHLCISCSLPVVKVSHEYDYMLSPVSPSGSPNLGRSWGPTIQLLSSQTKEIFCKNLDVQFLLKKQKSDSP